ncbi:MAG: hypothetical protein CME68_03810 [Halobacteriovoraceae bacterium]|nr:hypothetical protein [Halobacteriovoraceae bacterium]|tara:strand:+ start:255 stop:542 length:288 start_codon:yes stop_codon:yes gene_type:complete
MKKVCLGLVITGFLTVFGFSLEAIGHNAQEKKECTQRCYKNMYQCLVEGTNLSQGVCFSENVGQMLMCIDSKGMGSLKKKRLCFGQRKSCVLTCQ